MLKLKIKSLWFLSLERQKHGFVQLIDVPRLASVRKGDTIVTGGQSVIFQRISILVLLTKFISITKQIITL
jgi:hypothetical protein